MPREFHRPWEAIAERFDDDGDDDDRETLNEYLDRLRRELEPPDPRFDPEYRGAWSGHPSWEDQP